MEENETMSENTENEADEKTNPAEEENVAAESESTEKAGGEFTEETAEETAEHEEISTDDFAKTLANPMFALFARGRSGGIEEAVRDFEKMMAAGRSMLTEEALMKMTPVAGGAGGAPGLSEHQRRIAREAGMSYREYYEIIRSIPTKTK